MQRVLASAINIMEMIGLVWLGALALILLGLPIAAMVKAIDVVIRFVVK